MGEQVRRWQEQGHLSAPQAQMLQTLIDEEWRQLGAGRALPPAMPIAAMPRPSARPPWPGVDEAAAPGHPDQSAAEFPRTPGEAVPLAPPVQVAAPREDVLWAEPVAAEHTGSARQAAEAAHPLDRGDHAVTPQPARPVHPLDRRDEPVAVPQPVQRPWTDMLHSFMEERNIRWGELLAAGLIVLCSVGLVISLRATLRQVPYFPTLLFTLFTVAFHSAGLYTLRQWKLETVSRMILLIGLVLVPLTFCAGVLLSSQAGHTAALVGVLALTSAMLGWVAWSASRVLVPDLAWPLAVGILLCGLALVPIQLYADHPAPLVLTLLAMPALAGLALVWGALLVRMAHWRQMARPRLVRTMRALGVSGFAFLVAVFLLLAQQEDRRAALTTLSPWLSLVASGLLAVGLQLQERTKARTLAEWRVVGTAIAIAAAAALLGLVAVAWPAPLPLVAVSTAAGAALVGLGTAGQLPLLWPLGAWCLALASLLGLHLLTGQLPWSDETLSTWPARSERLLKTLLMPRSSLWLGLWAMGLLVLARWMPRAAAEPKEDSPQNPRDEALSSATAPGGTGATGLWPLVDALHAPRAALELTAGSFALAGLAIALFAGFVEVPAWQQDRPLAGPLLAVYGVAIVLAGFMSHQSPWIRLGSVVLWLATLQVLWFASWPAGWKDWKELFVVAGSTRLGGVMLASLLHGCVMAAVAFAVDWLSASAERDGRAGDRTSPDRGRGEGLPYADAARQPSPSLTSALAETAAGTLTVALPLAIAWAVVDGQYYPASRAIAALAGGWLVVMLSQRWAAAWQACAALAGLAVVLGVAGWAQASAASLGSAGGSPGTDESPAAWVWTPRHAWGQTLGTAVAGAGLMLLARVLRRWPRGALAAAEPEWGGVERLWVGSATFLLLVENWGLCLEAIARELGFSSTEQASAPIPSASLLQPLAWAALAAVVAAWGVELVLSRRRDAAVVGWSLASFAAVGLVAFLGGLTWGASSLTRWGAALHMGIWAAVALSRGSLARASQSLGWSTLRLSDEGRRWLDVQPWLTGGSVILVLTVLTVTQHLGGATLSLPAGGLTMRLGPIVDLLTPLGVLALVLAAYAWRHREEYALGAWGVVQLGANLALVNSTAWQQAPQDLPWRVVLALQTNALAAAFCAAVWGSLRRWRQALPMPASPTLARRGPAASGGWLWVELQLWHLPLVAALLGTISLSAIAGWEVFWQPAAASPVLRQAGHALSAAAIALTAIAIVAGSGHWPVAVRGLWPSLAALVPVAAAGMTRLDPGGQWVAYHGLEAGWGLVGLAGLAASAWRREAAARAWSTGFLVLLLTLLALRGNEHDPQEPWWSLAALAMAGGMTTTAALVWRSIPWSWVSWFLAGLTVLTLCLSPSGRQFIDARAPQGLAPLVGGELVFLTLVEAAGGWLAVEIAAQRRGTTLAPIGPLPRVHDLAIGLLVACCLGWRWLCAFPTRLDALIGPGTSADWTSYCVWAASGTLALGMLVAAALWEARAWYALVAAYFWGLAAWGVFVGGVAAWSLQGDRWDWESWSASVCAALALHTAVCGQLWFYGANLAAWGARLGIADPLEGLKRTDRWLPALQVMLSGLATLGATQVVFAAELRAARVVAALVPAVAAWGLACLAQKRRQEGMQLGSLLLAGYAAVLMGWVDIGGVQDASTVGMFYAFRLLMVLCGLTFLYAWVLPRSLLRDPSWQAASHRAASTTAVLAAGTLVTTFGWEIALFTPGEGTPADGPQVLAVAVLMALGAVGLVTLALSPTRDPWRLSEAGREGYVYAAEAVLVLVFVHLYLCRPHWFAVGLAPYWPLVVLGIAFAGAGASEIAQRWQLDVLARPLKRSSQCLPLLPVLGWWIVGSQVDYALLLLAVGLVYLVLSWRYQSWASALAGVVAGNAALWRWYSDHELALLTHPQLWLVPPAASALVAAQWHRQRLRPQMLTAIRYTATLVIYVSSTSEIMVGGFADRLWPPLILMGLAVAGALAGIAMRVWAFLILGSAFTMVALLAMVRHAQREIGHVWPWWVFGITLGVMLLVLMGIFEKKRTALQRFAKELSHWDR